MARSRTMALPVSVLRKSRTGAARLRAHAVRPLSGVACAVAIGVQIDNPGKSGRCGAMGRDHPRRAARRRGRAIAAIYNARHRRAPGDVRDAPARPGRDRRWFDARAALPGGRGRRRSRRGLRARHAVLGPALLRRRRRAHRVRRRCSARAGARPAPARRARGRVRAPRPVQADEPDLHHQRGEPGRPSRGRLRGGRGQAPPRAARRRVEGLRPGRAAPRRGGRRRAAAAAAEARRPQR